MADSGSQSSSKRRWIILLGVLLLLAVYVESYRISRDIGSFGLAGRGSINVVILNYHWITDDTRFFSTFRAIHYPCELVDRWLHPDMEFSILY